MATIELEHVTKRFRGQNVVSDITMKMESGMVYGFRGINGSGKTMLMRLICGLIYPTDGKVRIDGKVLGKDMDFPENLGLLIENPAFLDSYSGFANLKLLASICDKISDSDIYEVLKRVGLNPDDKKKYKKYSLGMKQRLGIASAIMEKPEIVLLDEPTNALDTSGVEMLKAIVREEKERGALVIVTCHDTVILEEMSDTIFFLEEGNLKNTKSLAETGR